MTYSTDILEKIEYYASIYIRISDIAIMLELQAEILRSDIADASHPASKAYRKGKIGAKVKLHEQEMALAKIGSPLALENTRNNLLDMEDDE